MQTECFEMSYCSDDESVHPNHEEHHTDAYLLVCKKIAHAVTDFNPNTQNTKLYTIIEPEEVG